MAGGLDDVVGPADKPVVSVLVPSGEVTGQVPTARETPGVTLRIAQYPRNIDGQPGLQGASPSISGARSLSIVSVVRQARTIIAAIPGRAVPSSRGGCPSTEIRDHDPTRLGLPPVVVKGRPNTSSPPYHCLRIQWFTHARR